MQRQLKLFGKVHVVYGWDRQTDKDDIIRAETIRLILGDKTCFLKSRSFPDGFPAKIKHIKRTAKQAEKEAIRRHKQLQRTFSHIYGLDEISSPEPPFGGWRPEDYNEVFFDNGAVQACEVVCLPHTIEEEKIVAVKSGVQPTGDNNMGALHECANALVSLCDSAKGTDEKGRVLEQLMDVLFRTVPGLSVSGRRIRTETEEIDLVLENDREDPRFRREGALILVECKNWSSRCGKNEFVIFKEKLRNRKGRATLGFLISWNGFSETITKEMLRESHEHALIVPLEGQQIRRAIESSSFWSALEKAWDDATRV